MPYRFAKERLDYSDYASGRVFYGLPGHPALPIRLTSEIFQRCTAVQRASGKRGPYTLYDPCCGGAYHLSTLAYWHWHAIKEIIGSDADADALSLAERNLSLLTTEGLDRRVGEIAAMLASYGKESHAEALRSAVILQQRLAKLSGAHQVKTRLFQADATDREALQAALAGQAIDIVFSDVPYGMRSEWWTGAGEAEANEGPVWLLLRALAPVLPSHAVVAIVADKRQRIRHEEYQRVDRLRMGKRQVELLQPTV